MLIMGVDPGTAITGYGLVYYCGNSFKLVECGAVRTKAGLPLYDRLHTLYSDLTELIKRHKPDQYAVEELFFNKNTRTAMAVGHARGVALLAGANAGLKVFEYTPLQVKQSVVGYGRADKKQVQYMIKTLLNLAVVPKPDDVADALAVAVCHAHHAKNVGRVSL
uniref:crossover junction endodeoxyribonuclease RuvC n=1 Tax=Desulforadius tongensis TaxID=1216062 RepID=UPI0019588F75|nr:crossover junction endodeoxyribonuclease RuvC [Desulforadius tongensis]